MGLVNDYFHRVSKQHPLYAHFFFSTTIVTSYYI